MTAYGISPVGANGVERHREQVIDIPSRLELAEENRRLRTEVGRLTVLSAEAERWRSMCWKAHDKRIETQQRLSKASRVLASLGRLSPRMAALVEASRKEIWRLDR